MTRGVLMNGLRNDPWIAGDCKKELVQRLLLRVTRVCGRKGYFMYKDLEFAFPIGSKPRKGSQKESLSLLPDSCRSQLIAGQQLVRVTEMCVHPDGSRIKRTYLCSIP